ncbi:RdgB/HAM1 family non-canonical purine NTP pyrophosphatase [Limibacillus sp. MBR-115]|jgi:XTP/dITP diphosphohydrolase|uniref:RdgB/HAM1 family non-canonical purine NTP pyrophosphatase n=1 Tax=Limibacillus sp. MBR-115 TaxID=3156465 RepID=UPI0033969685
MSLPPLGDKIVIASHNNGKVGEIGALLAPWGIMVRSAAQLGLVEPEETASTFAGNAELKARAAARATGLPALADDSGLAVTALGGNPGIYSARWAGPEKDFGLAMEKVNAALGKSSDRSAVFICVLCLAWPDGNTACFEGLVAGNLVWPPRGKRGFGYDPMFVPKGHELSFGEMEPARKHAMSHRAQAFSKLVAAIAPNGGKAKREETDDAIRRTHPER